MKKEKYEWKEQYLSYIPEEKRKKYNHGGVYSIWIDNQRVYIGKSRNMLERLCDHLYHIIDAPIKSNKYRVLRQAGLKGYKISFDVISYEEDEKLRTELEGAMIRNFLPPLNYQIPKEDGTGYTINKRAQTINLGEIITGFEF